jgi:MICOS complex subunit MIC12
LTYSVLYLTIYLHKANRNVQHTLLAQSSSLLNSVVEPPTPIPDPPPYEVRKAGLTEQLKDRWNSEIEHLVRKVQTTDWQQQREIYEQKVSSAWSRLRQTEQAKELEQRVKETVDATKSQVKDAMDTTKDQVRDAVDAAKGQAKDKVDAAKQPTGGSRLLEVPIR